MQLLVILGGLTFIFGIAFICFRLIKSNKKRKEKIEEKQNEKFKKDLYEKQKTYQKLKNCKKYIK